MVGNGREWSGMVTFVVGNGREWSGMDISRKGNGDMVRNGQNAHFKERKWRHGQKWSKIVKMHISSQGNEDNSVEVLSLPSRRRRPGLVPAALC